MIGYQNKLIKKIIFWDKRSDWDKYFGISRKERERIDASFEVNWGETRDMMHKWIFYRG